MHLPISTFVILHYTCLRQLSLYAEEHADGYLHLIFKGKWMTRVASRETAFHVLVMESLGKEGMKQCNETPGQSAPSVTPSSSVRIPGTASV
jgi:hypothetical protein